FCLLRCTSFSRFGKKSGLRFRQSAKYHRPRNPRTTEARSATARPATKHCIGVNASTDHFLHCSATVVRWFSGPHREPKRWTTINFGGATPTADTLLVLRTRPRFIEIRAAVYEYGCQAPSGIFLGGADRPRRRLRAAFPSPPCSPPEHSVAAAALPSPYLGEGGGGNRMRLRFTHARCARPTSGVASSSPSSGGRLASATS